MSKFYFKPVFRVCSFLDVIFLRRINMNNHVLLVSCVDFLKTKFTFSISELRVDHRFLLLEMNIFLFQLEFSSVESTEALTTFSDPSQQLPLSAKISKIPSPDLRLNFLLKRTAYQNHK